METTTIEAPYGSSIYTLAQSGTSFATNKPEYVTGTGSDMKDSSTLNKRAKKKIIGDTMAINLVDVAMGKNEPQRVQSYWNTFHCQDEMISSDNKLYTKYCKNRFCPTCLGIRKAVLINRYLPVVNTWEEPYFVTLTVKSYGKRSLKKMIDAYMKAFDQIREAAKKRHQRGRGAKFVGIRALECTFNPVKRTYHPHFHIIVSSKENADYLLNSWLKKWGPKYCSKKAQDSSPIRNNKATLIEIIKYGSKIFTEQDLKKKSEQDVPRNLYVSALDNILAAMKGHRIFERFGFNRATTKKPKGGAIKKLKQYDEWEFIPKIGDWSSIHSGEFLTNYKIPFDLTHLLENNVDVLLE